MWSSGLDDLLWIPAMVRAVEDMFFSNRRERELCESRDILISLVVVQNGWHIGSSEYRKFERGVRR